jgi:hypothetical protein
MELTDKITLTKYDLENAIEQGIKNYYNVCHYSYLNNAQLKDHIIYEIEKSTTNNKPHKPIMFNCPPICNNCGRIHKQEIPCSEVLRNTKQIDYF